MDPGALEFLPITAPFWSPAARTAANTKKYPKETRKADQKYLAKRRDGADCGFLHRNKLESVENTGFN